MTPEEQIETLADSLNQTLMVLDQLCWAIDYVVPEIRTSELRKNLRKERERIAKLIPE